MVACCLFSGEKKSGPLRDPRTNCVEGAWTLALKHHDFPVQLVGADEQRMVDGCWPDGDVEILMSH